jgi:hypothetical protein
LAPGQGEHRNQQQRTRYTLNRTNDHLRIVASTWRSANYPFDLFVLLSAVRLLVRGGLASRPHRHIQWFQSMRGTSVRTQKRRGASRSSGLTQSVGQRVSVGPGCRLRRTRHEANASSQTGPREGRKAVPKHPVDTAAIRTRK